MFLILPSRRLTVDFSHCQSSLLCPCLLVTCYKYPCYSHYLYIYSSILVRVYILTLRELLLHVDYVTAAFPDYRYLLFQYFTVSTLRSVCRLAVHTPATSSRHSHAASFHSPPRVTNHETKTLKYADIKFCSCDGVNAIFHASKAASVMGKRRGGGAGGERGQAASSSVAIGQQQ